MKYRFFIILFITTLLGGCYEDYLLDSNGFADVYFPYQTLSRSAVSGEGLEIKVGVGLGGVRENTRDHTVNFAIDTALLGLEEALTPNGSDYYNLLPEDYYTLSDESEIIIPSGKLLGFVDVQFDSLKMAADEKLNEDYYALPFRIVSTSADSILTGKDFAIIPIKLMNTYEGMYYTIGHNIVFEGSSSDTAAKYGDLKDLPSSYAKQVTSLMMDSVIVEGVGNSYGDDYGMKLKINPGNNSVEIFSLEGSEYQVEQNGESTWNPVNRSFSLKYKYEDEGKRYEVEETLLFRNRVRDGINEWRWDGFPGN